MKAEEIYLLKTKAAQAWLKQARKFMTSSGYVALYNEALRIAHERKAPRLGKIHCELALEKLSGNSPTPLRMTKQDR